MENWQIVVQNLFSLSESPRFPETKARRNSSVPFTFQLLFVVTSMLRPAIFSHYLSNSNTWPDESLHLHIPPGAIPFSCCDTFLFSPLPWQTCMGKDVTLHVSASNPAMLLYQKFGFKSEEYILDFYDKYYPLDSKECKHAFFLRLRRWSIGAVCGFVKSPVHQARNCHCFQWRTLAAMWELEHTDAFVPRTFSVNTAMLCAETAIQEDWFLHSKGRGLEMPTGTCWNHWKTEILYREFSCHCYFEEPHWQTDKQNKHTNKITCHFRGAHGFLILKPSPKFSVSVFVYGKWTSKLKSSAVFLWFDRFVRNQLLNLWREIRYWGIWLDANFRKALHMPEQQYWNNVLGITMSMWTHVILNAGSEEMSFFHSFPAAFLSPRHPQCEVLVVCSVLCSGTRCQAGLQLGKVGHNSCQISSLKSYNLSDSCWCCRSALWADL